MRRQRPSIFRVLLPAALLGVGCQASRPEISSLDRAVSAVRLAGYAKTNLPSERPRLQAPARQPKLEPETLAVALGPVRHRSNAVADRPDTNDRRISESPSVPMPYRLSAGDLIRVDYLHLRSGSSTDDTKRELPIEELDRIVRVQPDGIISLPYVGFVAAAGRSIPALTNELNQRYREYYVEPSMSVALERTSEPSRDRPETHSADGSDSW